MPDYAAWQHGYVLMGRRDGISGAGAVSRENEEKILYIAGMDWENQVEADDPVVNLNLFNADQDEPLLTPEE